MASFGYTINEIVRFQTDCPLKQNYAATIMRIHQDIKGHYNGLVRPVPE